MTDFIRRLPDTFYTTGQLVYEKRNTVKRYEADGVSVVAKKYKHPNLAQRIAYTCFKSSKAKRAYEYAARLRGMGIESPHEVAYIEIRRHGLFTIGFFLSRNCDYQSVSNAFPAGNFDHDLADKLAMFLVELHTKGVLHGDLNLTNILYHVDDDGKYHFVLIDTNRSVFKHPTRRECLDNLKRITHKRELLVCIISLYARHRGWNPDKTVQAVIRQLGCFEYRKRVERIFRNLTRIRHN